MDVLVDQICKDTEDQQSVTKNAELQEWMTRLDLPPSRDLGDTEWVAEAIWTRWVRYFNKVKDRQQSQTTAVADDEDAPAGWDNASLLAGMAASMGVTL